MQPRGLIVSYGPLRDEGFLLRLPMASNQWDASIMIYDGNFLFVEVIFILKKMHLAKMDCFFQKKVISYPQLYLFFIFFFKHQFYLLFSVQELQFTCSFSYFLSSVCIPLYLSPFFTSSIYSIFYFCLFWVSILILILRPHMYSLLFNLYPTYFIIL